MTVNCLVERDPTSKAEIIALIARPGTEAFEVIGTAPIRLIWQKQGLFDNDALILASNTLYRLSAAGDVQAFTGTIAGDGLCIADGGIDPDGNSLVRIATGTAMYTVSGSAVAAENFPDSSNTGATSVAFLSGYFWGAETGTDFVYYIEPGGTTWNPIEFAAAEYSPDKVKGVVVVGELAALLGEVSTEFWRATGDATSPIEPAAGLKYDIGCRSIYAAVNCRGTLLWVDQDCAVRMSQGGVPTIISDHGLAEQIRRSDPADLRASFFVKDQHPVYVLTLGTAATWLYDLASKEWTRATSAGYPYWRQDLFCNIGDVVLARDVVSNQIYRIDPDLLDDDGTPFTMEFCAYLETKERPVQVANVDLHCEVGGSPRTGQGSDPLCGLQTSRDGGKTFNPNIRYRGLGATGEYMKRVRWNGLGQANHPQGMWFKWFISDPVVRRVSGASVNVP